MVIDETYIVGITANAEFPGSPGKVIGVFYVTPRGGTKALHYLVKWSTTIERYIPITNTTDYAVISFDDIVQCNIPAVQP